MTSREEQVTATLVRLADTLVTGYDVAEMFYFLVDSCKAVLEVDQSGLMLTDADGALHVVAATSETTHLIELLQIQNDEGPCLDAVRTGQPVNSGPFTEAAAMERWPILSAAADQAGFTAICAVPMRLREQVLGALNLFYVTHQEISDRDLSVAQAFANIGSIAILQDRAAHDSRGVIDQLQRALNTRVVIEQAKGLVAQHSNLKMDQAFDRIRGYSRDQNLRLSQVASDLVAGEIDPKILASPVNESRQPL